MMKPNILKLYQKENAVGDRPNAITSNEESPIRFDIPMNLVERAEQGEDINLINRLTVLPMISNIKNINKSYDSLKKNKDNGKIIIDDTFLEDLREFGKGHGIVNIGFTKLPQELIFKEKAVLYENAIVLVMEMDKENIALAPHLKTVKMIMHTYNNLGIAANKVATYLRKKGHAAQASHPLGGIVLYPPIAKSAGLGWNGRHGLLITPEFGARCRLAVVFTDIPNLPFATENEHSWIPDYCATCGKCISNCPPKAIHEQPIEQRNGRKTCIDNSKCFPYFAANYGCTICIKVCPFSTTGYEKLKAKTLK
ncbi:MAG: 4Fe-4S dicluster domain-containing protein [Candidatus Heimdallarchaeota archaeon]